MPYILVLEFGATMREARVDLNPVEFLLPLLATHGHVFGAFRGSQDASSWASYYGKESQ